MVNASTGEVLYDRGGTSPSRTASVMKVLTSAAALSVLGPDYRATTTVVKGAEPGSAVLVGGGDVTLSRTSSGTETVYPGAAHLDDLAAQVRAAWDADPSNPPLTKLVLDASLFGGDEWEPSWDLVEREDGLHVEHHGTAGGRRPRRSHGARRRGAAATRSAGRATRSRRSSAASR